MDPCFLEIEEVLAFHADQIARYGGAHGLRDAQLLESALAQPRATFGGAWPHPDVPSMAAAYLYHVCQDHPFLDGNKRVGLECALLFMLLNGHNIEAPPPLLESLVMETAEGRLGKAAIAAFFTKYTKPSPA